MITTTTFKFKKVKPRYSVRHNLGTTPMVRVSDESGDEIFVHLYHESLDEFHFEPGAFDMSMKWHPYQEYKELTVKVVA